MLKPDKPEDFVGKPVRIGDRVGVIHNVGRSGKFVFVLWNGCDWPVQANWKVLEIAKNV